MKSKLRYLAWSRYSVAVFLYYRSTDYGLSCLVCHGTFYGLSLR